ncbi:HAMP domain-containing sensor histidine kinase [Chelativorans sp. M5D2P16]|uniref:sensor histidine kinase n=1 Tax=Chelativorans sp. M5D2P16 TaxID=3095678 RepID=UPI002ACABE89|nr:HAMP domain-containing sensor histidine kinase [Chelativorans sp. M5D2P16]MDZ5698982.1 HAMP domain-containing sensor histidine kinase [Chelativorans sp. M5D2P16]
MKLINRIRSIPISYRMPLIVALLMVAVSAAISERVLDRLSRTQERFLDGLAQTYLDGLSSAVLPAVLRADVWEVFDALDRSASSYGALAPLETIVTGADGRVLAASDPGRIAAYSELPDGFVDRYGPGLVTIDETSMTGFTRRELVYQGLPIGTIHATFNVAHLFAERREILITLLVTNGALAALFSLGGFLLVRRMIGPMRVLESHMRAAANGTAEPISPGEFPSRNPEVASLFRGYNALVHAERERADLAMRLAEEEKVASLGRLASGMAHEINNPLGGLFNALDTLKKHGSTPGVRTTSINLIERGLQGIREVVEAALANYRPERSARPISPTDLEDVRLLLRPELRRRRQRLAWTVEWSDQGELPIKSAPVRQAILNLLLNASAVTMEDGEIGLAARVSSGELSIEIHDQGPGFPEDIAGILVDDDPGPALRAGGGLGLWMVRRVVDDLRGEVRVGEKPEGGTVVTLILPFPAEERRADAA